MARPGDQCQHAGMSGPASAASEPDSALQSDAQAGSPRTGQGIQSRLKGLGSTRRCDPPDRPACAWPGRPRQGTDAPVYRGVARAVISEADHSRLLKDVMAPDLSV